MKQLWNNFKVAFAMFSKIPMPPADWEKENMKYMLCFFPLIGMVIGLLTAGTAWLLDLGDFSREFETAVLMLIPVFVTGGIHVDGLLDTADALSSWQERSRRLEILKDSHAGAFAVITAGVYFVSLFGAYSQLLMHRKALWILGFGFMVSRCLSGIAVVCFPKARADGTVAQFSRNASDMVTRNVLLVFLVILAVGMLLMQPLYAAAALVSALMVFWYYHHMAMKYFGGTTGDLAGYFLCLCELVMAVVLAAASGIGVV